jgi:hypothetical protein
MRYRYTQYANALDPARPFLRPMVGVRIVNGNKTKGLPAVVDTGCDVSLAHTDIGTLVGIDVPTGRPYNYAGSVVGQTADAYIHTVHLIIVNHTWVDLDIAFANEMHPGFILLGQRGFFENFDVKFCLSKGFFEIIELPRPTASIIH